MPHTCELELVLFKLSWVKAKVSSLRPQHYCQGNDAWTQLSKAKEMSRRYISNLRQRLQLKVTLGINKQVYCPRENLMLRLARRIPE